MKQIAAEGLEALPELSRILINEAMRSEPEQHLGTGHYERSPERRWYANGYKPMKVKTCLGEIQFAVPQIRQGDFCPGTLDKGLRSDRAMTLESAEMYVQGDLPRALLQLFCLRFQFYEPVYLVCFLDVDHLMLQLFLAKFLDSILNYICSNYPILICS